MAIAGHITFAQQEEVIYGQPTAKVIGDVISRLGVSHIFRMLPSVMRWNKKLNLEF